MVGPGSTEQKQTLLPSWEAAGAEKRRQVVERVPTEKSIAV